MERRKSEQFTFHVAEKLEENNLHSLGVFLGCFCYWVLVFGQGFKALEGRQHETKSR
jgi:hypothetical protein